MYFERLDVELVSRKERKGAKNAKNVLNYPIYSIKCKLFGHKIAGKLN